MAIVLRISDSETLRRSARLKSMLLYLCDRAFAGHPEELTEQQIGVAVFGREPAYDSANDNVVRVAARQLRIKLQEYYATEGVADQEVLVIAKGSYVPEVALRERGADVTGDPLETAEARKSTGSPSLRRNPWVWIAALASVLALISAAAAVWSFQRNRDLRLEQEPARANENLVKAAVLIPGQRTLVIVGDPNLASFTRRSGADADLESYLAGRTPAASGLSEQDRRDWSNILSNPRIDTASLAAVARILQANPPDSHLMTVQHSAGARGPDFRAGNVVLIGDPTANPWMDLFSPSLNFQIFYDRVKREMAIRNRDPKAGEPAQFSGTEIAGRSLGFAHLGMRPNIGRGGIVLLLAGTTDGALAAAADFACNREALPRLCALLSIDNLQQAEGFEVVLRVDSVAGISREVQAVAHRTTLRAKP